jgi:hypothetical protein
MHHRLDRPALAVYDIFGQFATIVSEMWIYSRRENVLCSNREMISQA